MGQVSANNENFFAKEDNPFTISDLQTVFILMDCYNEKKRKRR
jgi:hypothetical protein